MFAYQIVYNRRVTNYCGIVRLIWMNDTYTCICEPVDQKLTHWKTQSSNDGSSGSSKKRQEKKINV